MYAKFNYRLMGLVLLLFMVIATGAQAGGGIEWTGINEGLPNDVQISALAVDPTTSATIYAAGSGGVYKTTNSGDSWTDITGNLAISSNQDKEQGGRYTALAVDSSNIYFGCSGKIFKGAKDGGGNWQDITGTMTISTWSALSIVVQAGNIYVGAEYSGVYKSMDGGASWLNINKLPLPTPANNSWKMIAGTSSNIYAVTYQGLFITTDGGQTWGSVSSSSFQDMLVYPDVMYATTWNGIFKSTNNGANWGTKTAGLPSNSQIVCLTGHPSSSSTLYAWVSTSSPDGRALYKSTNGGDNWGMVTTLSPSACAAKILITTNAVYVAGKGIHKSTDNDARWGTITTGLPHLVDINTIAADPKATGTVYMANWRGVFKSTDAGDNWQEKNAGLQVTYDLYGGFSVLAIDPNDSRIIYAGKSQMLYKSTDGGENWGSITAKLTALSQNGSVNIASIAIDPNDSQRVYVSGGYEVMYKSTDAGTSWSKITIPQTAFSRLLIAPEDSSILYGIPSWGNNIYRSNNYGNSWTTIAIPIGSNGNINSVAFGTTSLTMYALGNLGYYQYTHGRILKTTDGGTWTQISDKRVYSLIVNPDIPNILYGRCDDGVIKSIDDGKSWGEANQGLPINTGKLISANRGSVGSATLVMDPLNHNRFYLNYPPYGIYRGTDTNTAPLPPTISTPKNGAKTSDPTPLIIGNSSQGSVVLVYNGATLLGTATPDSSGLFSLVSATLTTGLHTLKAISVDRFGTSSLTFLSLTIVPGIIPTIDSPASEMATNSTTITVSGMAEDGSTIVIYDSLTPLATVTAVGGFYSGVIILKDGLHRLFVTSINNNGVVTNSNIVEVLIDTVAPPAPWINEPHPKWGLLPQTNRWGILPSNNNKPQIKGMSAIPFGSITIYSNGNLLGTTTADNMGNFSLQVIQTLADGSHSITATIKDTVNISPASYPIQIFIDTKPVITQPLAGKTNNGTFTIIGTAPPDTQVGILIDNTGVATVTAGTAGTFTYEIMTPLSNGSHTLKAKNISGNSNVVKIMVDVQLPIDPINVTVKQAGRNESHIDENNKVQGIRNKPMDIAVPIKGNPSEVKIIVGSQTITLTDSDGDGVYSGSFTPTKAIDIEIVIKYASGTTTTMPLMKIELIDPAGKVYNTMNNERIVGATATCYWWDNNSWIVWPAQTYENQINPQVTPFSTEFDYSFLTPVGKYKIQVVAQGYYSYESPELEVIDIPVFHDVYMEPIPILTSLKVFPQAVVLSPNGTCSFTGVGYDQYNRQMSAIPCGWSCGTGSISPQTNSAATIFTASSGTGTYIITAATGSISSGTASITVREPVHLSLSPMITYARQNGTFSLNVMVQNVVEIYAAKIVLSFDKTKLRAETVIAGDFFKQGADSVPCMPNVRNDLGTVEISGARLVISGNLGVTGSGTLYCVIFKAIASDPAGTVSISDVILKDANMAIILPKDKTSVKVSMHLLGDFGSKGTDTTPNRTIDFDDLMLFTSYWNYKDMRCDIASTRTTGIAPNFIYQPDGQIDFEDLTWFGAMWRWYHTAGTSSQPAPLLVADTRAANTTAVVRLESALKQDEVVVDIVVENVDNLLSGHFVVGYDADRLELSSVNTPYCRQTQPGMLDISVVGLDSLLQTGTITQIVFKKRVADNGMPAVIYLRTVDLRTYQNGVVASVFSPQLKQLSILTDLNNVRCYPNPFVAGNGTLNIIFGPVTQMAQLKIYTIAGELVYDSGMQDTSSHSFQLTWDVENDSHEKVASGIYLYLITNTGGQTKTGKIGVVR